MTEEEAKMSNDPKTNEWKVLKDQFDALADDESNSIEKILDAEFHRRFTELMNRAAERATGHVDWSRR